jgi:hypothetical protein
MEYNDFEIKTYYKKMNIENLDFVVMDFLENHILKLMPKKHKEKILTKRL